MDFVLVPIWICGRLLDVNVSKGDGGGMSDHFLVEAPLKVLGGWRSAGRMEGVHEKYVEDEWTEYESERTGIPGELEWKIWSVENLRGGDVKLVKNESEKFRDIG